jgi:AcrR family transcriptional regulator
VDLGLRSRYGRRMPRATARRTQRERSEATTSALVEAARDLFAQDGYAATSLDAVVTRAGVTKGALYHHFAGKRELFEAVFSREQGRLLEAIAGASTGADSDPWRALGAGCRGFLDFTLDPGVQRIFLLDATAALGWERIREIESDSMALLQLGIEQAIEAGQIEPRPAAPLAHLLFGAICELAMVVARRPDQRRAHREAAAELDRVLSALAV